MISYRSLLFIAIAMNDVATRWTEKIFHFMMQTRPVIAQTVHISFIVVAINRRDAYKIIGLHETSHSIKQPSSSIYQKKR